MAAKATIELNDDYQLAPGPLRAEGRWLKDAAGRTVILRGPNFSGRHKQPPHVAVERAEALAPLREAGFNAIRLVCVWEAIEPEPGRIDQPYLERIAAVAAWAGEHGLHVIADMHQDIYSRRFGGSGAPEWAISAEDMMEQPADDRYWFLRYGMSQQVRRSLARFWRDEDGLQQHFADSLLALARRLVDNPAVVGCELYNEPFPGELDLATFEVEALAPFYQRLIPPLREIAPRWLVGFEGALFTSEQALTLHLDDDNLLYMPHFYDKGTHASMRYSGKTDELDRVLAVYERDAGERGMPWLLSEYGVMRDAEGAYDYLRDHERALERLRVGGTFWQYNPTALDWNDERMSVVLPDGEPTVLLDAVVHPYPRAVAGAIERYGYDDVARAFELRFRAESGEDTVISAPRRCYPDGVQVTLSEGEWGATPGGDLVVVRARQGDEVQVTVAPAS